MPRMTVRRENRILDRLLIAAFAMWLGFMLGATITEGSNGSSQEHGNGHH